MQIKSVQEYITLIEKLKNNYTYSTSLGKNPLFERGTYKPHFIFRGHSNDKKYNLLPQVLRWNDLGNGAACTAFSQLEYNILKDFMAEACRFVRDVPTNDIPAWLEIAQHYGVPTRLLDFTENPLIALYFACSKHNDEDASVWIIDEYAYNKKLHNEVGLVQAAKSQDIVGQIVYKEIVNNDYLLHVGNSEYIQYPWIYKPLYREERMNLQSSIFMIWGAIRNDLKELIPESDFMKEQEASNADHGIICKILIPANKKEGILQQLNLLGISEKFIYPGMDGVGKFINEKYSSERIRKGNTI